jgi:hypothetical protein
MRLELGEHVRFKVSNTVPYSRELYAEIDMQLWWELLPMLCSPFHIRPYSACLGAELLHSVIR